MAAPACAPPGPFWRRCVGMGVLVAACCSLPMAWGQSVALSGVMGSRALLVVDGGAPKTLAIGDVYLGVKLVSAGADLAVVEVNGQRRNLRVGDVPLSVGGPVRPGGTKIVLPLASGGHFYAQGMINQKPIQFMVDTGATTVALGMADAQRLGIDYAKGAPVRMNTANGVAQAWVVKLASIRIGDVEVFDVDAVVGPNMPFALLGNNYLSRFSINRNSDTMVLERRY